MLGGRVCYSAHAEQLVVRRVLCDMGLRVLLPLTLGPVSRAFLRKFSVEIQRAQRSLKGETLEIVRCTKKGDWAMARPCSDCKSMLLRVGIRRVSYSTPQGMCAMRVCDLESTPTATRRTCPPVHFIQNKGN